MKTERVGIFGNRYVVNIAYVILPTNVAREAYVQQCIRSNVIDCITETGDFIKDAFVAKGLMSNINFPAETRQMGTAVILLTIPKQNKCVVVGILPKGDEIEEIKENQFYFVSESERGIVTLAGIGSHPGMYINIDSFTEESGELVINIANRSNTGSLKINVKGTIEVFAEDKISISSKNEIVTQILDSSGAQKRMITLTPDYVILGEGTEPVLLGDTTKQFLSDFIDEVAKCTTATALGTMPILNAAQITLLKLNIDNILSKKVKTD